MSDLVGISMLSRSRDRHKALVVIQDGKAAPVNYSGDVAKIHLALTDIMFRPSANLLNNASRRGKARVAGINQFAQAQALYAGSTSPSINA